MDAESQYLEELKAHLNQLENHLRLAVATDEKQKTEIERLRQDHALNRLLRKDAEIQRLKQKIKEQEEYIQKLKRNAKGVTGQ